jgi:2-methylaconitate cis-trans-isomerase PrpF
MHLKETNVNKHGLDSFVAPLSQQLLPLAINEDSQQIAIPCLFMRGGSSRGGFFLASDLPSDPVERDAVLLAAYGSPDVRQIDGIGGADPLTSKAAIVSRSERDDADLEYTFCQIDLARAQVSTGGNCGNMLAAVGPFGVLRGLIKSEDGQNCVRIFTTNTGQIVQACFEVKGGAPCVDGSTVVPGVPGSGAMIAIDFGDCAGSVSGKLLPTGNATDTIIIDGKEIKVSLIDAATPFVFVNAKDIDGDASASPEVIEADKMLMNRLEQIRGWAATVLGIVNRPEDAVLVSPNMPRVIMISQPMSYSSNIISTDAAEMDLTVRQIAMQKPHKALAVTGAVCTAVACQTPGSIVAQQLGVISDGVVRLGHPSGVLSVSSHVETVNGELKIHKAAVNRTARLIMAGMIFVARSKLLNITKLLSTSVK